MADRPLRRHRRDPSRLLVRHRRVQQRGVRPSVGRHHRSWSYAPSSLLVDHFDRFNGTSWDTTDSGQTWSPDGPNPRGADWHRGWLSVSGGELNSESVAIALPTTTEITLQGHFADLDAPGGRDDALLRIVAGGCVFDLSTSGKAWGYVSPGASSLSLLPAGVDVTAPWTLRLQGAANGPLWWKIWQSGGPEPTAWREGQGCYQSTMAQPAGEPLSTFVIATRGADGDTGVEATAYVDDLVVRDPGGPLAEGIGGLDDWPAQAPAAPIKWGDHAASGQVSVVQTLADGTAALVIPSTGAGTYELDLSARISARDGCPPAAYELLVNGAVIDTIQSWSGGCDGGQQIVRFRDTLVLAGGDVVTVVAIEWWEPDWTFPFAVDTWADYALMRVP